MSKGRAKKVPRPAPVSDFHDLEITLPPLSEREKRETVGQYLHALLAGEKELSASEREAVSTLLFYRPPSE